MYLYSYFCPWVKPSEAEWDRKFAGPKFGEYLRVCIAIINEGIVVPFAKIVKCGPKKLSYFIETSATNMMNGTNISSLRK